MATALTDYYFDNLKNLKQIKKDLQHSGTVSPVERNNMYLLSFMGLLREGVRYERKDNSYIDDYSMVGAGKDDKPAEEKKKSKLPLFGSKDDQEKLEGMLADNPTNNASEGANILVIKREMDIYECPEKDLIDYFGDLYKDLMDQGKKGSSVESTNDYLGVPMMDIFADDDDKKPIGKTKKSKKKVKEAPKGPKIPIIESAKNLPDDPERKKPYDSFLFNQHFIVVPLKDNQERKYITTVYPLFMNMDDAIATDILVVMRDEAGRMRCNCSSCLEGDSKQIDIDFTECQFVVRGKIENGDFISTVTLVEDVNDDWHPQMNQKIIKIRPTLKTSTFYQRIWGKDGTVIDIFPTQLRKNDNETGIAPTVMIIERGEPRQVLAPTGKNSYQILFEGDKVNVFPFWEGNNLICNIVKSDD